MKKHIKDILIIVVIVVLIFMRLASPGHWFGSVVVFGFLVAWSNLIFNVLDENKLIKMARKKKRLVYFFSLMSLIFLLGFVFAIINIINSISWLSNTIVLDIITLCTLFLSLPQKFILDWINTYIDK